MPIKVYILYHLERKDDEGTAMVIVGRTSNHKLKFESCHHNVIKAEIIKWEKLIV